MRETDFLPETCPHLAGVGAIITDEGLAYHHDIRLARAASSNTRSGSAFEQDGSRALALKSLAAGHPVSMRALDHIEAAASHWQRGDRALANLRLALDYFAEASAAIKASAIFRKRGLSSIVVSHMPRSKAR